jgi:hypothetical protein
MSLEIVCDACGKRHTLNTLDTFQTEADGLPLVQVLGWGTLGNRITGAMMAHACSRDCARQISREKGMEEIAPKD